MTWLDKLLWAIVIKIMARYFDTVDVEKNDEGNVVAVYWCNYDEAWANKVMKGL